MIGAVHRVRTRPPGKQPPQTTGTPTATTQYPEIVYLINVLVKDLIVGLSLILQGILYHIAGPLCLKLLEASVVLRLVRCGLFVFLVL